MRAAVGCDGGVPATRAVGAGGGGGGVTAWLQGLGSEAAGGGTGAAAASAGRSPAPSAGAAGGAAAACSGRPGSDTGAGGATGAGAGTAGAGGAGGLSRGVGALGAVCVAAVATGSRAAGGVTTGAATGGVATGAAGGGSTTGACAAGRRKSIIAAAAPSAHAVPTSVTVCLRRGGRGAGGDPSGVGGRLRSSFSRASRIELTTRRQWKPGRGRADGGGREGRARVAARRGVQRDAREPADDAVGADVPRALEIEHGGGGRGIEEAALRSRVGADPSEQPLEAADPGAPRVAVERPRPETLEVARQDVRLSVPGTLEQRGLHRGGRSIADREHGHSVAHRDQRGIARPGRARQLQLEHRRDVEQAQHRRVAGEREMLEPTPLGDTREIRRRGLLLGGEGWHLPRAQHDVERLTRAGGGCERREPRLDLGGGIRRRRRRRRDRLRRGDLDGRGRVGRSVVGRAGASAVTSSSVDIGSGAAAATGSSGAGSGAALATTAETGSALPCVMVRSSGGTPNPPARSPAMPAATATAPAAQAARGFEGARPGSGSVTISR